MPLRRVLWLPLPHPSAGNTPWFQRNLWFEHERLPVLRERIASLPVPPTSSLRG
ncbi:MAG: hypothetical protein LH481_13670 [Burkholderiales bacterium]|nr:hypothetical protein [Burkholderiales bacterium]